ncbi:hypothetical protein [Streptomyces sp. NBC_00887]|uniref:hypothetical protein n=1 Tax=Streptomyces sp. NBC_00887 TaxID=2975859 RepID=UPI00386AD088|nr:hypothetical protein OG844_07540 [Streptomyces sp. NBC_00887]WSY35110.1 hypothetical protein OG844_38060 [Streptomyces sp. NBC_00887]
MPGGDAPFERITRGEAEAVAYVEGLPGGPGRLLWLSDGSGAGAGPALSPGILRPTAAPRDPVLVGGLVAALREAGPQAYLMAGHRQAEYLRLTAGHSASWERRLVRSLDARPDPVRVLSNDDAHLYALRGTGGGPPRSRSRRVTSRGARRADLGGGRAGVPCAPAGSSSRNLGARGAAVPDHGRHVCQP